MSTSPKQLMIRIGIVLSLLVPFAAVASAKRCLVQEDAPGGGAPGRVNGGSRPPHIWTTRVPLPPAGSVAVENVQGDIAVEAWDRAEVEITVAKRASGPGANPDDVRIEVDSRDRSLTLRTIYPQQSDDTVRVDYRLRVPRQVRLDRLRTIEGTITVRGIEGSVNAHTLNGNIEQRNVSGNVVARAMNGNVLVALRALPEKDGAIEMDTVNGHLFLLLPPQASADLQLSTVAGRISCDYPTSVSQLSGDTSRRARVGQGGVQVRLRTVRGNISVAESEELL
ncbi:MAG: DUF4097 family beta strand repeat-containing protein [Terriglobales bacterium]